MFCNCGLEMEDVDCGWREERDEFGQPVKLGYIKFYCADCRRVITEYYKECIDSCGNLVSVKVGQSEQRDY